MCAAPVPAAWRQPLSTPSIHPTGGTLRWSELRRVVEGVSEKMLAQTLQTLERDGFVWREAEPVIPPRVDYSLTDRGREVVALMLPLMEWIGANAAEILEGAAPV